MKKLIGELNQNIRGEVKPIVILERGVKKTWHITYAAGFSLISLKNPAKAETQKLASPALMSSSVKVIFY